MNSRGSGEIRRSQVITTYGPGALIDLPEHSAIVGGLETWPAPGHLTEIVDSRLTGLLQRITGIALPKLYEPPAQSGDPWKSAAGIGAWRFPEWFVVQERDSGRHRDRSRRLVHRKSLDEKRRFENRPVVPTRFVRACPRGHVDDIDWAGFVHGTEKRCNRQLWLDESGATGDLSELRVRCECSSGRSLYESTKPSNRPLGKCQGKRPWLGLYADELCSHPSRLLIRTASNAYFPQVVSALSLPDRGSAVEGVVKQLWDDLQIVEDLRGLRFIKKKPSVNEKLNPFADAEVLSAIEIYRKGSGADLSVKEAEMEALLSVPEGFGDDIPIDPNFHARKLPDTAWRATDSAHSISFGSVTQVHRLREILALIGFTRLEAVTRDVNGEYQSDVERAGIALEPSWFPAVENRGEGVFAHLRPMSVEQWMRRESVASRIRRLCKQHDYWQRGRGKEETEFPGGPYILLHTLSHLLIQSLAMRCGYPASSIRERIYVVGERYGLLLYTGTPDAEGTLGGLVQQARNFEDHLAQAVEMGMLCSNDPICAQHSPSQGLEERWLHGAACHGCALIAETSCEMNNDYLDRALVAPVIGLEDAAFFPAP